MRKIRAAIARRLLLWLARDYAVLWNTRIKGGRIDVSEGVVARMGFEDCDMVRLPPNASGKGYTRNASESP